MHLSEHFNACWPSVSTSHFIFCSRVLGMVRKTSHLRSNEIFSVVVAVALKATVRRIFFYKEKSWSLGCREIFYSMILRASLNQTDNLPKILGIKEIWVYSDRWALITNQEKINHRRTKDSDLITKECFCFLIWWKASE